MVTFGPLSKLSFSDFAEFPSEEASKNHSKLVGVTYYSLVWHIVNSIIFTDAVFDEFRYPQWIVV